MVDFSPEHRNIGRLELTKGYYLEIDNAKDEQPFLWLLDPFVGAMSFILIAPLNGSSQSASARLFYPSRWRRHRCSWCFVCLWKFIGVSQFLCFMSSLSSFCAQAKPMRDEPVCLCVCVAQTFYLFYLCLSICALWRFATLRFVCANNYFLCRMRLFDEL